MEHNHIKRRIRLNNQKIKRIIPNQKIKRIKHNQRRKIKQNKRKMLLNQRKIVVDHHLQVLVVLVRNHVDQNQVHQNLVDQVHQNQVDHQSLVDKNQAKNIHHTHQNMNIPQNIWNIIWSILNI